MYVAKYICARHSASALTLCNCGFELIQHMYIRPDNEIDGQGFLDLTEADVKGLVSKLGVVKKILRLKTVCPLLPRYSVAELNVYFAISSYVY